MAENRLDGLNPLSYMGVAPQSVSQLVFFRFDPTPQDWQNFKIGAVWINTVSDSAWILLDLSGNVATWVKFAGSTGNVETLTGNSGGAVGPLSGNINVVGSGDISVTGNPGTHTLTISQSGSVADSFPTDSGTAVPALGVLNVLGGISGRDINTSGSSSTIHIDLKNAISLGDLSAVAANSPALTLASGDIQLTGNNQVAATNQKITFKTNSGQDGNISMFLNNVFIGQAAGNTTMTGLFNVGIGPFSCSSITSGGGNVGVGNGTLQNVTTGSNNNALGYVSGNAMTTGSRNSLMGDGGGTAITTGSDNTTIGYLALSGVTTGSSNVAIGSSAGSNYTTSESSNLVLGNAGTVGESNVIRIGTAGGGAGQQNKCFVAGIRGITTGVADAIAVLVDSANQLGTVSSSIRFKENIEDMGSKSDVLMSLRPVVFNYKDQVSKKRSYGFIAEEVEQIMPELVVHDEEGLPLSLKYHEMPAMLLNEIQKLHKRIELLEKHECSAN